MDFVFVRKHASKYGLTCLCAPGVNDSRHESESVISAGMQTPRHCFLPSFLPSFAGFLQEASRSRRDAISIAIPETKFRGTLCGELFDGGEERSLKVVRSHDLKSFESSYIPAKRCLHGVASVRDDRKKKKKKRKKRKEKEKERKSGTNSG